MSRLEELCDMSFNNGYKLWIFSNEEYFANIFIAFRKNENN